MKKLILLFAVLAFVACGKDEPEQPKLYNPDVNVILHAIENPFNNNSFAKVKLCSASAPSINLAEVLKNENNYFHLIVGEIPIWEDNEDYLNTPTVLERGGLTANYSFSTLGKHNFDTINNRIIFPMEEVVRPYDGRVLHRLLGCTFWSLYLQDGDPNTPDEFLGYIPCEVLWENQQRFKDYYKANQYDSIYNMLENDYSIVWTNDYNDFWCDRGNAIDKYGFKNVIFEY